MMIRQRLQQFLARILGSLDQPLKSPLAVKGNVDIILRYSDLYPNSKLRGEVHRFYRLGHNLVVLRGRWMSAGLWAGGSDAGLFTDNRGLNELGGPNNGWVIRGMGVGEGDTPEADADTALETPITNPVLGTYYHELSSISYTAYPNTEVVFGRVFAANEPTANASIREFGLYTAAPIGFPVTTDPPGPVGGPYLIARKTHGLITKTSDFTMEVLWTIEF
jgi:hypothetical protein